MSIILANYHINSNADIWQKITIGQNDIMALNITKSTIMGPSVHIKNNEIITSTEQDHISISNTKFSKEATKYHNFSYIKNSSLISL